jgi:two-component system OmpR family sensor kinase
VPPSGYSQQRAKKFGSEPEEDRVIRRSWFAGLGIAALAAFAALAVYAVASWTLAQAAPNIWFDANNRARIADDIQHTATRLAAAHRSRPQIAKAIVDHIDATSGYTAAVVDDNGTLLAGSANLVGPRPPRMRPPSDMPPLPPPDAERARSGVFRGLIYGMHPPFAQSVTFFRWPFGTMGSPSSIVHIDGALVIFAPPRDALAAVQSLEQRTIGIIVAVTFVLVWLLAARLFGSALRPLERLRGGLLRLAHGDTARIETFSPQDEVAAELAEAYNAAATQVETVATRQREMETKIRQFVADAGHELRTPLAVIMGYVQLLRQSEQTHDALASRVFTEIDDQGKRMSRLIQKLLLLTRLESQEPADLKILDAADVAKSVVESFRPLANGATLETDVQSNAFVQVSESELHEAIGNLLDNAIKYAPGATVRTRVRSKDDSVLVTVADNGPGMSPDVRARAFERFSRGETGGSISGSGLGLAIVERALERAGGTVSLETQLGKGTTVELRLPAWRHL